MMNSNSTSTFRRPTALLCLMVVLSCVWWSVADRRHHASAQDLTLPPATEGERVAADEIQAVMKAGQENVQQSASVDEPSGIDMLTLILSGGRFMIPIGLMSVLVVTLAVERMLSMRQGKVLPRPLVSELKSLADPIDSFDPVAAYQQCLKFPSPAASVIGSMLLRTGQPLGEIERAAAETTGREAERYAAPVRWLSLAAAATPLMGLLGTVWGMIVAFHDSTSLSADRSRSEQLSEGIYTALVTTLAGLAVAIPAAIFAQYLENRISKLFHQVEQLAFDLAPGLSRFAGRKRLDPGGELLPVDVAERTPPVAVPPPPPKGDEAAMAKSTSKTAKAS